MSPRFTKAPKFKSDGTKHSASGGTAPKLKTPKNKFGYFQSAPPVKKSSPEPATKHPTKVKINPYPKLTK